MITVFGDAVVNFVRDDDGRYHEEIGSYSYEVACALRRFGSYPDFICGLGRDPVGSFVVSDMVDREIMFDPDLCLLPFNSAIRVEGDGTAVQFLSSTAMTAVDEQKLADALSVHSNIKCIHLSSLSLSFNPVGSSYLDLASFLEPRPFIFADLTECFEGPVFSRHAAEAAAIAHVLRCSSETEAYLEGARLAFLGRNGAVDIYEKGSRVCSVDIPGLVGDDPGLTAYLLASLEKEGFFQEDGVRITCFDPGAGMLARILSSYKR